MFMALIASSCLSGGTEIRSYSHNYTATKCTFLASVQQVGIKLKSSIPTNIVISQNNINHTAFSLGVAVLGSELRLPCYKLILSFVSNSNKVAYKTCLCITSQSILILT